MKTILILLFITLIGISCKKEEEVVSMQIEEITYPLEGPAINTNRSVEPKIRVRNNGNITVSSFAILYNIDINNTNGGYVIGPSKTYFANLKPNQDTLVTLDKWESYAGIEFPLQYGTHMLFIKLYQINGTPFHTEDKYYKKRLFILQE